MTIFKLVNTPLRGELLCDHLRAGVSLQTLAIAVVAGLASAGPVAAQCDVTGSAVTFQCDSAGVNIQHDTSDGGALSVSNTTITSGWINYSVRPAVSSGPVAMSLSVSNSALTASGNGAVNVSSQNVPASITVNLGSDVTLNNTGGSGGLWVRNEVGGNILVTSGATITSTDSPALTATSNAGSVQITNTGIVTSTNDIGIYADGSPINGTTAVPVSVTNSGSVNAYLAGIRAIDYLGTATIENSGDVTSTTRQGLVAWSQSGDVSISNSGSVDALGGIGIQAAANDGSATVTNTGTVTAASYGVSLDGTTNRLENNGSITTTGTVAVQTGDGDSTIVLNGSISAASASDTAISMGTGNNRLVLADTASLLGNVVNGSSSNTLELTGSATGTLDVGSVSDTGTYQGFGNLIKSGSGQWTLTGTSSSITSTTIEAGTLTGNTASLTGDIVNNAALVFDQTTTGTYASEISGTGSLTKIGSGTLILTGDNTYSGGTLISEGTLQIGDGGTTGSIQGNVVNNATLVFNRSGIYDFPGTITGSGAVTMTGGSTVNFTSAGGYTGDIVISGSSLVLASGAVSSSDFTIADDGTISGTGTIAGLIVESGGAASPGYSPGTLTVTGDVTFNAGSVYNVDVTPSGDHDLISATGTATLLGGTVAVNATAGSYSPSTTLTILQAAGGVTGTFSNVTSNLAFLTPQLSYDANDVYLTLLRNDITFASQALTSNQRAVAVVAETLGWNNSVYSAIANLETGAAASAFDSLSGEAYASASTVMQQQSLYLREAVNNRLEQAFSPSRGTSGPATAELAPGLTPTVWMQGFGGWSNAWGDGNAATISSDVAGVFAGMDVALDNNGRLGFVGGYSRTRFDVAGRSSSGTIDHYDLGVYAGTHFGDLNLKGGVSYTWHDVTMGRTVAFSGYNGHNTADYDAGTTQVFGEAAYNVRLNDVTLQPFAGLAYVHLSNDGFAETGSSSALSGNIGSMETVFTSLGMRLNTTVQLSPDVVVAPNLSLGWLHASGDVSPDATMALASGSQTFGVTGAPLARDSAVISAGIDYNLTESAILSGRYNGQFASGIQDNSVKLSLKVKF
ncbi:outer membrane autotransporter protein [Agrobacterium vitis]|nr:outer membrane autotransporter protein [Agrobacterium vitis]MBE1439188.1 outer membrane autotransporter protein [Agrobacterium vitis]